MWAVAKIKRKNLNVFIKELTSKTGTDIKFYYPKIQHHKYIGKKLKKIENCILENYIFCYHEKFSSINFTTEVQFIKGLDYFLKGHTKHQEELTSFINYCKSFENKDGYLTSVFFKTMVSKKAQFVSGPFTNVMFEIIERKKNKLKILIGNIVTTVSDNKNYLYRPI